MISGLLFRFGGLFFWVSKSSLHVVVDSAAAVAADVVAKAVALDAVLLAVLAVASLAVVAVAACPGLPLGSPIYVFDWMGSCWRDAPAMHKSCISEAAQGITRGT